MPQRKNAWKALSASEAKKAINQRRKKKIKEAVKTLSKEIEAKDTKTAKVTLVKIAKNADKAAAKKVIHKNKAARIKSRTAKKLNKAEK